LCIDREDSNTCEYAPAVGSAYYGGNREHDSHHPLGATESLKEGFKLSLKPSHRHVVNFNELLIVDGLTAVGFRKSVK